MSLKRESFDCLYIKIFLFCFALAPKSITLFKGWRRSKSEQSVSDTCRKSEKSSETEKLRNRLRDNLTCSSPRTSCWTQSRWRLAHSPLQLPELHFIWDARNEMPRAKKNSAETLNFGTQRSESDLKTNPDLLIPNRSRTQESEDVFWARVYESEDVA